MVFKNRSKQTNSCSLTWSWIRWADDGVFIAQLALQVVIGGPRSDKTAIHRGGGAAFPSNCRDCETMDFSLSFSFLPFPPPRRCGIVHEEQEAPLTSKSPLTNWPPSQKWVWLCRIQQKSRALINHWARHLSPERVEGGGGVGGWP